ncbi:MAG: hypothetical protein GTN70_05100 [Deltaproteobacteria bacterium]|nr:hypothetical protein [Deltaproteobacteria bacterium]NIS77055.1 hypothetical protein [Deltaproteobacteria bacterium]
MKRIWLLFLVGVVSVGLAVPAFAEHEVGGFYRAKGWVSNYQTFGAGNPSGQTSNDPDTSSYVEQRARFKFTFSNNEYAKAILYIESDLVWGDDRFRTGRNGGGALGGDSVNIEVKDLYTWFKIPDTDYEFQVGLQNFNDAYYGNFVGVNDMGGVLGKAKFENVSLRYGWFKWLEAETLGNAGGNTFNADDLDFYLVEAKFKPSDNSNLGVNVYYMNDDRNRAGNADNTGPSLIGGTPFIPGGSTTDLYIIGANGVLKLDAVTLSGFAAYQTGEVSSNVATLSDRDISAFGVNLRADMKLGDGDFFVEGIYLSGDDDSNDNDIEGWQVAPDLNAPFYYRSDMQILFYNGDDETTATAFFADGNTRGNPDGAGAIAIMAGYKFKPAEKWQLKIGAGWAQDAEGNNNGAGLFSDEKSIIEVNGTLRYAITKGLTAGVEGAWGFVSDLPSVEDNTVEADDLYMAYWRVNYSF